MNKNYLTAFSYFPLKKKSESCRTLPEQIKKWRIYHLRGVVDGFSYFK
jgi:hypothetical protein